MSATQRVHAGWYKRLFAWAMARGYSTRGYARYEAFVEGRKRALLGDLRGVVVEIGPGTGENLRYYPPDTRWIGVEPNPYMRPYIEKEAARLGRPVELRAGGAERLEMDDASADAVVSTLVLCSVRDVRATLAEIRRVLKPGGRFVFIEHVAGAPGSRQLRTQRLLHGVWGLGADGCRPDQATLAAIESAGFARVEAERFTAPMPVIGPHIAGVAYQAAN